MLHNAAHTRTIKAIGELELIIVELIASSPEGLTNAEVAEAMGIKSAPNSPQKN